MAGLIRSGAAIIMACALSACGRVGYDVATDAAMSDAPIADALADASLPDDARADAVPFDATPDAPADAAFDSNDSDLGTPPGVLVMPTSGLVTSEAGATDTFTIVLTSAPLSEVTIALSSSNALEGTVSPASVVFSTLNWNAPRTVTVTGVDDALVDGTQAYSIITSPTSSADLSYNNLAVDDVAVSNTDNETPGVTMSRTSGLTTTEGGGTDTFTIVLDAPPSSDVSIELSTDSPLEATVAPATITFTSSNWASAQTVTVTGVDDSVADGNQPFIVLTSDTMSSDPAYDALSVAEVSGENIDDETPGILVDPLSGLVTTEAGDGAMFTVVLQSEPAFDVTIPIASLDVSEGTVPSDPLTFTSANWNIPQAVFVSGTDDSIADGDQLYAIDIGAATSADPRYEGVDAPNPTLTNLDDESAGVVVTPLSGLLTSEGGATATYTIVLRSQPTASVFIGVSSTDTTEGTVTAMPIVFTTMNWSMPRTITVTGVNDSIADGDQAYESIVSVLASGDPSYSALAAMPQHVGITNLDDETVGVAITPTSGLMTTEAGGTDTFTIVLDSQPTADVSIGLSSNTSSEGIVSPASVTFTTSNWNSPRTITVTGVNDAIADGARVYHVVTANAVSTDAAYNGFSVSDVMVTNLDDDAIGVTVTPTSSLVTSETGTAATFTVVLTSQPTASVSFALSSSDTTEGTVSPASVDFTTGNWNVPQTVTVTGVDDAMSDGNIPYTILVAAGVSADSMYNGFDPANVSVTNTDNDVASVVVTPTSGLVTTEAGGTASFTVVLSSPPSASVTISIMSSDATEGTAAPASLVFTGSDWSMPQTVVVTGVNDAAADGNVAYTIVTGASVSADLGYSGLAVADVSVSNTDDDAPAITVVPTSGLVTTEAGAMATFTVVLATLPSADVSIALTSSDLTEGTVSPAGLTFTNMNWNMPQTVTVTGVDDLVDDGNIVYSIVTGAAVSADGGYSGRVVSDVSVSNTDNDTAGVTATPTSGLVTTEAGGTATFSVVLLAQPASNVTIALSSSDATEGSVSPADLTFTNMNWNVAQIVTVTGVDDFLDDNNIAYTVVTANAASADPSFNNFVVSDVSVTNSDDDSAGVTVTPTSGLVTTELGGSATFTIVLQSQPSSNVTISVSSNDGTEGSTSPGSVTFTSGNWSTPQTVTVTGVNDTADDGDILYAVVTGAAISVDPSYSGRVVADVSVTNTDDDVSQVILTPQGGATTTENGGEVAFDMSFTVPVAMSFLNINFTTSDPTEGTVVRGSVGVSPVSINASTNYTVVVRGVDDLLDDGDISYTLTGTVSCSDPNYNGTTIGPITITNIDNDSGDIVVSPTSVTVTESASTATTSIVLARAPSANVVIGLSSSDTGEATVSPATLTFTTANWSTPRTVTVTGVSDGVLDGTQSVNLVTAPATSTDGSYSGQNGPDAAITVIDVQQARIASVDTFYRPIAVQWNSGTDVLSNDGRYVAFQTINDGAVLSDADGSTDVFRRDRQNSNAVCSSVTSVGGNAGGSATGVRMSGTGRYVAFGSAYVIVPGDANSRSDVYVRDHMLNASILASVSDTGAQLNQDSKPSGISDDGRYVVFETTAAAVAGDTNGVADIFVRDTMLNTTVRASVTSAGTQGTLASTDAVISADGRYVAFTSTYNFTAFSSGFNQIYIRDLVGGTTTLGSLTSTGVVINHAAANADLSYDGRYLVFMTFANNVVPGDTNATYDVFVRDLVGATTTRVSVTSAGAESSSPSHSPVISGDGTRVAFVGQGALVAADTNAIGDVYVRDLMANTTTLVSTSPSGAPLNMSNFYPGFIPTTPSISGDGHTVAFSTYGSNVISEQYDTNNLEDLYVISVP